MDNGAEPAWLQAITSAGNEAVSELERENSHFEVSLCSSFEVSA